MLKAISISAKDKESALRHKEDETEHHNQRKPSGECSKNKCFELVVRFVCEISREPEGSQRNNPQRATSHATQSQHAGRGMSLAGHPGKVHGTEVPTSATARDQKLFPVAGKKMGISSRIKFQDEGKFLAFTSARRRAPSCKEQRAWLLTTCSEEKLRAGDFSQSTSAHLTVLEVACEYSVLCSSPTALIFITVDPSFGLCCHLTARLKHSPNDV